MGLWLLRKAKPNDDRSHTKKVGFVPQPNPVAIPKVFNQFLIMKTKTCIISICSIRSSLVCQRDFTLEYYVRDIQR